MEKGRSPGRLAWHRFRRNIPAMIGLGWLLLCALVAMFAYACMPDDTHNGNFQIVELPKQPPGTAYTLILRPNKARQPSPGFLAYLVGGRPDNSKPIPVQGRGSICLHADTLSYLDLLGRGQTVLLPELVLALDKDGRQPRQWKEQTGKPYLIVSDSSLQYMTDSMAAVTTISLRSLQARFWEEHVREGHFWLGSDAAGRDVLSRLLLGTRVSMGIGLMAVWVSLCLGVGLGAVAGFFRGRVDRLIMWFVSVTWSLPTLLLAISLAFVLGKGIWQLFLAIGISSWVEVARIVRGRIFSLREMQFVEATRALGYRWPRVVFRHILPNVLSPLIIIAAANFAAAILMEAGLSFLGVGAQPPVPSWGSMIKEGYAQVMFDSGIWLAIFPGLAIIMMVISLNLVGFGLRDALDPKHRG
jgi:ABC-type dipeptide/oligopeptide/nickel transport system permease subunit